ncbi:MAG: 30S ribosome-binding factor RbfA [Alphaproteobacteria bacterium]|nr:30S ribosome-binding factor RbfA [Alphaproteobacteria bacterium]
MASSRGKAPSQRQLRVGEELRHALAAIFERGHFRDPVLTGATITVTEVRVAPDLRKATVFVTPLGGEGMDDLIEALERAAPYLRTQLTHHVRLRYLPSLAFRPDVTFEEVSRIEALLHRPEVAQDLADGVPPAKPRETDDA